MIKFFTMTALAAAMAASMPAAAQPGIVLQGPSATGFAAAAGGGGGNACPIWRCGLNGTSFNGLARNGLRLNGLVFNGIVFNGWTLNGIEMNGVASGGAGFAATAVTLPSGELLAID